MQAKHLILIIIAIIFLAIDKNYLEKPVVGQTDSLTLTGTTSDAVQQQQAFNKIINQSTTLLKADFTSALAGLALAAAAFTAPSSASYALPLEKAKKDFVKAFFLLLICTAIILSFDITQVTVNLSELGTVDFLSTYSLFGAALFLLSKGARAIYEAIVGVSPTAYEGGQTNIKNKILAYLGKADSRDGKTKKEISKALYATAPNDTLLEQALSSLISNGDITTAYSESVSEVCAKGVQESTISIMSFLYSYYRL